MQVLKSKDNPTIKKLLQLKTKKGRSKNKAFLVDGLRIVQHALDHQMKVEALVFTDRFLNQHKDFLRALDHYKQYCIDVATMGKIVDTQSPQGICAVVEPEEREMGQGWILFLDQIQDPGNLGTLIRTADAAGFAGVILREGCTDPYSQKVIRSSMGSIMSLPIWTNKSIESLRDLGLPIYGAALEGGESYKALTYPDQGVLVIGNEANGITPEVLDLCNQRVYIPMAGHVESLNASIAGGILMFAVK